MVLEVLLPDLTAALQRPLASLWLDDGRLMMIPKVHVLRDQTSLALFWVPPLVREQLVLRAQDGVDNRLQGLIMNQTAVVILFG